MRATWRHPSLAQLHFRSQDKNGGRRGGQGAGTPKKYDNKTSFLLSSRDCRVRLLPLSPAAAVADEGLRRCRRRSRRQPRERPLFLSGIFSSRRRPSPAQPGQPLPEAPGYERRQRAVVLVRQRPRLHVALHPPHGLEPPEAGEVVQRRPLPQGHVARHSVVGSPRKKIEMLLLEGNASSCSMTFFFKTHKCTRKIFNSSWPLWHFLQ